VSKKWYEISYMCRNTKCDEIIVKELEDYSKERGELYYYARDFDDPLKEFKAKIKASSTDEAHDRAIRLIKAIENLELDALLTFIYGYIDDKEPNINIHINPLKTEITVNY